MEIGIKKKIWKQYLQNGTENKKQVKLQKKVEATKQVTWEQFDKKIRKYFKLFFKMTKYLRSEENWRVKQIKGKNE